MVVVAAQWGLVVVRDSIELGEDKGAVVVVFQGVETW